MTHFTLEHIIFLTPTLRYSDLHCVIDAHVAIVISSNVSVTWHNEDLQ